jgi:hypothetical protein
LQSIWNIIRPVYSLLIWSCFQMTSWSTSLPTGFPLADTVSAYTARGTRQTILSRGCYTYIYQRCNLHCSNVTVILRRKFLTHPPQPQVYETSAGSKRNIPVTVASDSRMWRAVPAWIWRIYSIHFQKKGCQWVLWHFIEPYAI